LYKPNFVLIPSMRVFSSSKKFEIWSILLFIWKFDLGSKDCAFSKTALDAPSHAFSLDWASYTLANLCHQLMKGTRFYKKSKIIKNLPQH
jgi:hypothetical protein